MEAIELLKQFKKKFDPQLKKYLNERIKTVKKIDPLAVDSLRVVKKFILSGGKRLRPALTYYSFLNAKKENAKDEEKILQAAMSIEIIHAYLLIHDDIIDKDSKRHNVDTVHEHYRKLAKRKFPNINEDHFGNSIAIIVGDITSAMANDTLLRTNFPNKIIVESLQYLQDIVYKVIPGEMLDVYLESKGSATEKEILRMHKGKTAQYTFEGPLLLGCLLADNHDKKTFSLYSDYSNNLGVAFQIRDDILGTFGNEKKLGKPIGSDIISNKQTLLVIKALQNSTPTQRKIMKNCLGNKNLIKKDLEKFKKVIIDTGSLKYSENLSNQFVKKSLLALEKMNFKNKESEIFLKGIAEYIINREK